MNRMVRLIAGGMVLIIIVVLLTILSKSPVKEEQKILPCNQIIDKAARDKCFNVQEETKLDESLNKTKEEYSGASIADMKLLSKALRNKNKTLCSEIVDTYTKDRCVNS